MWQQARSTSSIISHTSLPPSPTNRALFSSASLPFVAPLTRPLPSLKPSPGPTFQHGAPSSPPSQSSAMPTVPSISSSTCPLVSHRTLTSTSVSSKHAPKPWHVHFLDSHVVESGFDVHLIVCNSLIHMYADYGCLDSARHVFDQLGMRSVVTWCAMISGYARHGYGDEALQLSHALSKHGS